MELVTLGKIQGLFGVNGWVKVFSWTDPKENIFNYFDWYLCFDECENIPPTNANNKYVQKCKLKQGKKHKKGLIASFVGIEDADSVQVLLGAYIKIDRLNLPILEENEYYWHDLIGLDVFDLAGNNFGVVKNLMQTGANDCLVVRPSKYSIDGRERVLPYLYPEVIKLIDLKNSIIKVDWDKNF